jgi:2-desacetyl-2-hydroxyethyl bacteriochlorophyllide A dehydrogenase
MKALVYTGPREVEVREMPVPEGRPGMVKIRMHYCGLCGTDIGIFSGKHPRAQAPLVLGHEFVGTVAEAVPGGRFSVGDRVVAYPLISCGDCYPCRNGQPHVCASLQLIGIDRDGGMAEYAWVDEATLFRLDDALDDESAALVEPLAVVVRSLHQARFQPLDRCVVLGAGPIGLLTALVLRRAGAGSVIVSDVQPGRLDLCRRMGFDCLDSGTGKLPARVAEATGGDGADIVFECAGAEPAALEMTRLARVGGTICMTGIHKAPHAVDLMAIGFKELTLVGTRVYTLREFGDSVALARDMAEELRPLITHRVPLSRAAGIFDLAATPEQNAGKILVDCRA